MFSPAIHKPWTVRTSQKLPCIYHTCRDGGRLWNGQHLDWRWQCGIRKTQQWFWNCNDRFIITTSKFWIRVSHFMRKLFHDVVFSSISLCYKKKILKYSNDKYDLFLCFLDRWIWIWHPFCCTRSMDFCISIEKRKKITGVSDLQL